jgi:hypothetical protein
MRPRNLILCSVGLSMALGPAVRDATGLKDVDSDQARFVVLAGAATTSTSYTAVSSYMAVSSWELDPLEPAAFSPAKHNLLKVTERAGELWPVVRVYRTHTLKG